MSSAVRILQGGFGRAALLQMDQPLVPHAHSQTHVLLKASGADTWFGVRGTLQPLTDRTAVLVNAWEPHFYGHRRNAPQTLILALYVEPGWLAKLDTALATSAHPHFYPSPCVEISRRVRALTDALVADMLYRVVMNGRMAEERIFELMIAVIDRFSEWRALRPGGLIGDARVRRAIGYMRENLGRRPDMAELAGVAGLSRAHFFELFRKATNLTPGIYFNVLRMETAFERITRSNVSLAELTLDLGFSAQSHFCRFFRHHQGVPPSEYRKVADVFEPVDRSALQ